MFLSVEHLYKSYGTQVAIQDISFELEKGNILCLLGPSGCGKSTVLNALGGFISIDSGKISLDGKEISHLAPEDRDIATVFQSYGLFPHMTVLENIQYGLKFKDIPRKERRTLGMEMVERMNLLGHERKKVAHLSGGQQQRVALGRSLIIQPDLLLLDEPLSNLDARLRVSLREEIRRIQREFNVTMVFVTHDQLEAFEIADDIILMNQGHIEQQGSAQDLYLRPTSDFVRSFVGSSNHIQAHFIRPESVIIHPLGHGIPATIESLIFQGPTSKVILRLENGDRVESLLLNPVKHLKPGDDVSITFPLTQA